MESTVSQFESKTYKRINLIADPIYGYIRATWSSDESKDKECTEKNLIDTPWLQRLRRIHQLQAVWWVFPGGEHTRFQHSLGAMHLGGLFASHLYDSIRENFDIEKSKAYVEEVMRLAGLLHDVGHGPFCHFFDEEYLKKGQFQDEHGNPVNHEILGQKIIREKLRETIEKIRRSPSGDFKETDGLIDIDYLCYLIKNEEEPTNKIPTWLQVLKGLMTGVYTIDNLDYVWRDAYMCGILPKPIDVERIKHYTFTTKEGLVLYPHAIEALEQFLRFRFHMYFTVYYHRTVRAIELHMREIFTDTMQQLHGPSNPYDDLDRFLSMDDWNLLCSVQEWVKRGNKKQKVLANQWKSILERKPRWGCICERRKDYGSFDQVLKLPTAHELKERVRQKLGLEGSNLEFSIDLPEEDPRRLDPLYDIRDPSQVKIYDPATRKVDPDEAKRLASRLPAKSVVFRLYVPKDRSRDYDQILTTAFESVIQGKSRRGKNLSATST